MMHSHLDSFIYTLLSTDAHHNSKTVLGFSIYDSSTMKDLNHQPVKWNGSELNHEVFLSVSLSKERNLCYTVFALTKKAVLNTGLTILQIPTAKLGIPDTGRVATGFDIFLSEPWASAAIFIQLYAKGFPKVTSSLQKEQEYVSVTHIVTIVVLGMRS